MKKKERKKERKERKKERKERKRTFKVEELGRLNQGRCRTRNYHLLLLPLYITYNTHNVSTVRQLLQTLDPAATHPVLQ